jgi:exosortase
MSGISGIRGRHLAFAALLFASVMLFWPALKVAFALALEEDRYLQIALAPVIVPLLLYWRRAEVFASVRSSPRLGIPLLVLALLLWFAVVPRYLDRGGAGLMQALSAAVAVWIAGFLLCYGTRSLRAGCYPLGCLLLMIPLPAPWMNEINTAFQHGSAAVSYRILWLSGLPVLRKGMQFSIPGLTFEVAPECSGIRSSLAMIVVAIVAGYVYLRSAWARSGLVLLTIPIVLFKNAVRIVAVATLGAYVDRLFIDGPFHRYGGVIFSILGVVLFVLALGLAQRIENRRAVASGPKKRQPGAWRAPDCLENALPRGSRSASN